MTKWLPTLELSLSSQLILLLVGFSSLETSGKGCDLQYLKAPPSRLECNPYSISSVLKLECQVQAPASVGGRVEIEWFFSNTILETLHIDSTSFPSLLKTEDQRSKDGDVCKLTSSIAISNLTTTHQGMYFCQVALDGNITSLSPSGSILLEDEDDGESDYLNLHPCSQVFVEDRVQCAGNIQSIMASSSPSSSATSASTTAEPFKPTTAGSPYTADASEGTTLTFWVFVLVAITTAFGMIIVALSIVSVGLCLKMVDKSKHASSDITNRRQTNNESLGTSVKKPPEAEGMMINSQA